MFKLSTRNFISSGTTISGDTESPDSLDDIKPAPTPYIESKETIPDAALPLEVIKKDMIRYTAEFAFLKDPHVYLHLPRTANKHAIPRCMRSVSGVILQYKYPTDWAENHVKKAKLFAENPAELAKWAWAKHFKGVPTADDIKRIADKHRQTAAEMGTWFHSRVEAAVLKGEEKPNPRAKTTKYQKLTLGGIDAIKINPDLRSLVDTSVNMTEVVLLDPSLNFSTCDDFTSGIAGTADLLKFKWNEEGQYHEVEIFDFKTSEKIDMQDRYSKRKMQVPFESFDCCNFNHYSLQLWIYGKLLERMAKEQGLDFRFNWQGSRLNHVRLMLEHILDKNGNPRIKNRSKISHPEGIELKEDVAKGKYKLVYIDNIKRPNKVRVPVTKIADNTFEFPKVMGMVTPIANRQVAILLDPNGPMEGDNVLRGRVTGSNGLIVSVQFERDAKIPKNTIMSIPNHTNKTGQMMTDFERALSMQQMDMKSDNLLYYSYTPIPIADMGDAVNKMFETIELQS